MTIIKLQSNDGQIFNVDLEIANLSITIKTMLEDLGIDEEEDEIIPLPNVNSVTLNKVIQWATHHKHDPPLPEDDDESVPKRSDDMDEWDVNFLKVEREVLFDIILAANYLDIRGLLDAACKTLANMIRGKTVEEIRTTFLRKK